MFTTELCEKIARRLYWGNLNASKTYISSGALAVVALTCSACSSFPIDEANDIINDVPAIDALYGRLVKITVSDPSPMYWLSLNADKLPTLFRYELARRLDAIGKHELALKEVAKARLLRDMEAEQCTHKDSSRVKNAVFFTDLIETSIHGTDRMTDPQWLNAVEEALAWATPNRVKGFSSSWICGSGNVERTLNSIRASQKKYKYLANDFENLKSSAVAK